MAPTLPPSTSPQTSIPTGAPSITGAVGIVELEKVVTASLTDEEISDLVSNVADAYGVDEEDVVLDVVYQTTGSMQVTLPADVPLEEVEASLEDELAELLGVHESEIEVTVNQDGSVTYVLTSKSEICKPCWKATPLPKL